MRGKRRIKHDYTPKSAPRPEEQEEEEFVVPKAERKLPYFVRYALPGDQEYVPQADGRCERIEATSNSAAGKACKELHPEATHIFVSQANFGLFWREKGSKDTWQGLVQTDNISNKTFQQEVDLINWIRDDFEQKPYMLGRGLDFVPEFQLKEFNGQVPETL